MILILYRTEVMRQRHAAPLRLPFVGDGRWEVAEVRPGETRPLAAFAGRWLATVGLPIPPGKPDTATAWRLSRISASG